MPTITSPSTSVFLCDDSPEVRTMLRYDIEDHVDLRVVGEAGDGAAAIDGVLRARPDVILLDYAMPVMDGLEAIAHLRALETGTQIIVLSGYADDEAITTEALRLGARRCVSKSAKTAELVAAIREVAARAPA